ncbi:hypothetical protein GCM10023189_13580 [Nibrella saemangeumensis]|uniref:N-acetyltransferase domain-containing protein n=1 Tax=Nibrella saemangeumensis TaxID=1084526 RepID=A0ABP8MME4_9BACT
MAIRIHGAVDLNNLVLETARMHLKAIQLSYTDDIFREFTPEIARYMYPRPATIRTETEAFILAAMQENTERTSLTVVLTDKATGAFLGCAGLHKIDTSEPEFGIWLRRSAHGFGLGREAIYALKEWAVEHLLYDQLIYPADERNVSSLKIPESMGGKIARRYESQSGLGMALRIVEYVIA